MYFSYRLYVCSIYSGLYPTFANIKRFECEKFVHTALTMSIVQKYINTKGEFIRKASQFRNCVTGKSLQVCFNVYTPVHVYLFTSYMYMLHRELSILLTGEIPCVRLEQYIVVTPNYMYLLCSIK